MSHLRPTTYAFLLMTLLGGSGVHAVTLGVHCGSQQQGLSSIGAALTVLRHAGDNGPHTINVSGTCNEDVVIQSMDHLTLNAVNGASINDPSQGANTTLLIADSRDVAINNFLINGYAAGLSGNDVVACQDASVCRFSGNTVQDAPQGAGIGIWSGSYAEIDGGFLQNNSWTGLAVFRSARARVQGVTLQRNWRGIIVAEGGHLQLVTSTIADNANIGIVLRQGATLACQGCTVSRNGSFGISVKDNSVASFGGNASVTGNAGAGINLINLSSAAFGGGENVTGNNGGQADLVCNPYYTTVDGLPGTVGTVVNCP